MNNITKKSLILIFIVLLVDQLLKIYIKTNYTYGQIHYIFGLQWARLHFVENKGMAMGTKINDFIPFISENTGKLILTIFRVAAISGLGYWLLDSIKKQSGVLLCWALSLIFAGALGNIIDSIFYGVLFSDSNGQIAQFFPEKGYAPLFYGHVVDMLQFPLVEWTWPSWLPYIGGKDYLFFQYIFNIADTAISTGVGILIFFNKKIFA